MRNRNELLAHGNIKDHVCVLALIYLLNTIKKKIKVFLLSDAVFVMYRTLFYVFNADLFVCYVFVD